MDKEMIMASERFGNIEDLSYKDDISLFSQIGEYSQMQPFKLDVFVLLVCLNGHGSLNINGVDYRVDAGKMFVCKPHIIVEKSSVSLDFECRGMALSSKFIDQLGRVADGGWDLGVFLGKNPVLSLSDDEISLFMQYYALLGSKITRSYCRHQDAVMQALFRAFMLEFFDYGPPRKTYAAQFHFIGNAFPSFCRSPDGRLSAAALRGALCLAPLCDTEISVGGEQVGERKHCVRGNQPMHHRRCAPPAP